MSAATVKGGPAGWIKALTGRAPNEATCSSSNTDHRSHQRGGRVKERLKREIPGSTHVVGVHARDAIIRCVGGAGFCAVESEAGRADNPQGFGHLFASVHRAVRDGTAVGDAVACFQMMQAAVEF